MNIEQWNAVWYQAVARAWTDKEFKSRLLRDARSTLAEEFNCHIPDTVNLNIVDKTEDSGMKIDLADCDSILGDMELIELTFPPMPSGIGLHSLSVDHAAQAEPRPCCTC